MTTFFKTNETFIDGSLTLGRESFHSAEVFAEEHERIFTKQWFCAGHVNQIANAGNYFVLDAYGESIIILRDKENTVRAFYNVCRHRGTRMCEESNGSFSGSIQCPYHAWTYSLDGKLIGAPLMKDVIDFNKNEHPLYGLHLHVWEGFIFLNMSATPEPFEKIFAPIFDKFTHWNLPLLRTSERITYDLNANWKFVFQNYNECYHCPPVHPRLAKMTPYTAAENDLVEGPFIGGFMPITNGGSLTLSEKTCALPVGDIKNEDHQRVYYYSIFPNMLLSLHPDYVMFHLIMPQSAGSTIIHCDWLFHPDAFGREDFHPEDAVGLWDMTNKEDWHVCELSQLGTSSRSYQPSPYSPRESLPAAFDRSYLEAMGQK